MPCNRRVDVSTANSWHQGSTWHQAVTMVRLHLLRRHITCEIQPCCTKGKKMFLTQRFQSESCTVDELWRKNHENNNHILWVPRDLDTLTGYFSDRGSPIHVGCLPVTGCMIQARSDSTKQPGESAIQPRWHQTSKLWMTQDLQINNTNPESWQKIFLEGYFICDKCHTYIVEMPMKALGKFKRQANTIKKKRMSREMRAMSSINQKARLDDL